MNEKDALKLMQKVVDKVLPTLLIQQFKNIKTGSIVGLTGSTIAEVLMDNGVRVSNLLVPKGSNAIVGDKCVIISINNNNSSSNFIVAIY